VKRDEIACTRRIGALLIDGSRERCRHQLAHLRGVRYGRDFTAGVVGDIALARSSDTCASCGGTLEARRGIEMGNTFKPGTRYSAAMGATFADEEGVTHPLLLGSYGIGITRLLACIIEQHHDADGIRWPRSIAPYQQQLVVLGTDEATTAAAESIYAALGTDSTLYDDRELSAGVKLKDADCSACRYASQLEPARWPRVAPSCGCARVARRVSSRLPMCRISPPRCLQASREKVGHA
jgi:prolyl-tRNA synthetase